MPSSNYNFLRIPPFFIFGSKSITHLDSVPAVRGTEETLSGGMQAGQCLPSPSPPARREAESRSLHYLTTGTVQSCSLFML